MITDESLVRDAATKLLTLLIAKHFVRCSPGMDALMMKEVPYFTSPLVFNIDVKLYDSDGCLDSTGSVSALVVL